MDLRMAHGLLREHLGRRPGNSLKCKELEADIATTADRL